MHHVLYATLRIDMYSRLKVIQKRPTVNRVLLVGFSPRFLDRLPLNYSGYRFNTFI